MTPKQQRFVQEYLIDLNGTQAAIRAGYSVRTAGQIAEENLKKPEIAQAVSVEQGKRAERTEITADRVLQELAKIGFGDVRKVFGASGGLKGPAEMDDDTAATIASIEVVTRRIPTGDGEVEVEYVHKIKSWDKIGALAQIGRHLGMFVDKVEHSGNVVIQAVPLDDRI